MKVILISTALDEPYEFDSGAHAGTYFFSHEVAEKVSALLEAEKMRAGNSKHDIFGRSS